MTRRWRAGRVRPSTARHLARYGPRPTELRDRRAPRGRGRRLPCACAIDPAIRSASANAARAAEPRWPSCSATAAISASDSCNCASAASARAEASASSASTPVIRNRNRSPRCVGVGQTPTGRVERSLHFEQTRRARRSAVRPIVAQCVAIASNNADVGQRAQKRNCRGEVGDDGDAIGEMRERPLQLRRRTHHLAHPARAGRQRRESPSKAVARGMNRRQRRRGPRRPTSIPRVQQPRHRSTQPPPRRPRYRTLRLPPARSLHRHRRQLPPIRAGPRSVRMRPAVRRCRLCGRARVRGPRRERPVMIARARLRVLRRAACSTSFRLSQAHQRRVRSRCRG